MRRELKERGPALERKLQEHPEMLAEEELEVLMDFWTQISGESIGSGYCGASWRRWWC